MRRAVLVVAVALSVGCSKGDEVDQDSNVDQGAEAVSSISARWTPLRSAANSSMLSAPCVARAEAHATGEVSSSFRVQVKEVHVQVGDVVTQGQAIADVTSPEIISAAARYLGLSSRLKVHRERLEALGDLRKEGMVRNAVVFEQQALVAELSAGIREAVAVLRLAQVAPKDAARIAQSARVTLKAPVAGVVSTIRAHPGEVLDGAMTFAEIIGPAHARIEVSSPGALAVGEKVTMVTADGLRYELAPKPISTVVKSDTGMHQTWFALKDTSVLLSDGLRCSVEFGVSDDVWEVPVRAAVNTENDTTLLRRRGEVVKRIPIEIHSRSGASLLVRGELKAGDMVSADGSAAAQEAQ